MESYVSPVVLQYGRLLEEKLPSCEKELTEDFRKILSVLENDPQGWCMLSRGGWSAPTQERVMNVLLHDLSVHLFTAKFITTLIRHRRLKKLVPIIQWFEDRLAHGQGSPVFLKTAKPLSQKSQNDLTQALIPFTRSNPTLRFTTDSSLLGGAVLFWKDLMVDGSIRNTLHRLKTSSLQS